MSKCLICKICDEFDPCIIYLGKDTIIENHIDLECPIECDTAEFEVKEIKIEV